jgi:SM-20-related protein
VPPKNGTLVLFLSEEFPHEVLVAKKTRYSIAGWFRINNSIGNQIDPPR